MSSYEKKTISELKAILKENGVSQSGDKGTLIHRIKLIDAIRKYKLQWEGKALNGLKIQELRTACAKNGLSVIGDQDEMFTLLVNHLESKAKATTTTTSSSSSSDQSNNNNDDNDNIDSIGVAKRILELNEVDDYEGILNIATPQNGAKISKTSPIAQMRKNYLKLSLLVHPDKLKTFDQAKIAFQALVQAFDRLSSPEESTPTSATSNKVKTISRSNENCFRTQVCCPRCKQPWNENTLDGNPEYCYNFLMMGLKQFVCSTCLCLFGCQTAIHKCPKCAKPFEYSHSDFHRQITCGNTRCEKQFGFFLFPVSDRVMQDLKREVKEEQEKRMRARETKLRRSEAARRRGLDNEHVDLEKAFLLGLRDACPRCGVELDRFATDQDQRDHLTNCTDAKVHAAYRKGKELEEREKEEKERRREKQESVQTAAAWSFLGGGASNLWLLDDDQLRIQAVEWKVDAAGSRDELIERLGNALNAKSNVALLKDEGGKEQGAKRARMTAESLPGNFHAMGLTQLKSICVAHGVKLKEGVTRSEILEMIERDLHLDKEIVLIE